MSNYEEYYKKSIEALTQYIVENKTVPTEKVWNRIAAEKNFLTSQSLGYLSEMKFSDLCKDIYIKHKK